MDRVGKRFHFRQRALAFTCALVVGNLASPASAAPELNARLVRCGAESCLRVSGHRESPASLVRINGRIVPAEGGRRWQIDLPIETVRDWSPPYARTIEVSLQDPETQRRATSIVDLPIGLLGGVTSLASLAVSAG